MISLPQQAIDIAQLISAQERELTVRDLYQLALDNDVATSDDEKAVVGLLREHHRAYAQALAGFLGKTATNKRNRALYFSQEQFFGKGSMSSLAAAAQNLENGLIASYENLVATLSDVAAVALISSIIITEARHAVIMAELAGKTDLTDFFNNTARPISV